jgi:hypothetical protein
MAELTVTTSSTAPSDRSAAETAVRRETRPQTANAPAAFRIPADSPVDRPVVREAVRRTVTAAGEEARARVADAQRSGSTRRIEALDDPSPELRALLERMHSTVVGYVCVRRDQGVPVERVLPEVKRLVREAESSERWRDPSDLLMARAVRWSIEAYYDDPALRHVPRFY